MPPNILIIKLSAIGDVLMASPAFAAIRSKYPDAKITLLVGEWSKGVVETNPNIDEVIVIDENIFWKKRILDLIKLIFRLRKIKFDIVYVMHWSNLFNLFSLLLGAKIRIGFNRSGKSYFLTKALPFSEGEKGTHTIDKYLSLVNDEPISHPAKIDLYLSSEEIKYASNYISKFLILNSNIVGLAAGGGVNPKSKMSSRCWPIVNFVELVRLLLKKYPETRFLVLGGKFEKHLGDFIISEVGSKNIENLAGKLTIRETAAVMKHCKLVIANDSAPMHLASSVGVPVLSIFGPTAPYDKAPRGENDFYFYKALSCSPCYKYGKFNDCKHLNCHNSITPLEVYHKAMEYLK